MVPVVEHDADGVWSASAASLSAVVSDGRTQPPLSSSATTWDTARHGRGITGCCSVLSSVIQMQRSLTEVWSDVSDDHQDECWSSEGRTRCAASDTYKSLVAKEDDETYDNRAAYQRFFVSIVDSTDKLDRLLALLDTPARSEGDSPRPGTSAAQDSYDGEDADSNVQFNTDKEAREREELAASLRQLGDSLGSDNRTIDLRAVAFWCLAKRERLWAEDEKLTRAEQTSLRSIRSMQVNHEEVDNVLQGRRKRIEDNVMFMHQELSTQKQGWSEMLMGLKESVVLSSLHAQKRTRDILAATEERIVALKAELAEHEHRVVGLSNESESFEKAKNLYARKAEHLQQLIDQQRLRLDQIAAEQQRIKKEIEALDDSMHTVSKLESAAEGGGKTSIASREQNEGKEKLQALVREELRRHREEQAQAGNKRVGLLEENKRLRAELEKAETAYRLSQSPEEKRSSSLRGHQAEVDNLRAEIGKATKTLNQTERKLGHIVARKARRTASTIQAPSPNTERMPSSIPTVQEKEDHNDHSQAWYQLEILRAQHAVLFEDLEKSSTSGGGSGNSDILRERSLLAAAHWQLRDTQDSKDVGGISKREIDAALELAAVAIATDLTSKSSHLLGKISDTLEWEGQARSLEDKHIANASLVRWMYVLRFAVEVGHWDRQRWQDVQQLLVEPGKPIDLEELYSARDRIHSLLFDSSGNAYQGGIFSKTTESRGELLRLIECGHARLAKLNVLLRALWNDPADIRSLSSKERMAILNDVVGMAIGESEVNPRLALQLFSALGRDAIGRVNLSPESVPQGLPREITNLRLSPKGTLSETDQRVVIAVTQLAAFLRITEALSNKDELSIELTQRGTVLQDELREQMNHRCEDQPSQHLTDTLLGAAEDFIAEAPPQMSEHGPGNSPLDIMLHLLDVIMSSGNQQRYSLFGPHSDTPRSEMAITQGSIPIAAGVDGRSLWSELDIPASQSIAETSEHHPDGQEGLKELLKKISNNMPSGLGHHLARVWSAVLERIRRPRGEEVELEALELAIDAQVLENLAQSLRCALEDLVSPGCTSLLGDPPTGNEEPMSDQRRPGNVAPSSDSDVRTRESQLLQRRVEALKYKKQMKIVALTGLPLQDPRQTDESAPALSMLIGASKLAKRWKHNVLTDGSGVDRQELERINSLMDMRIKALSEQLAKLEKENKQVETPIQKPSNVRGTADNTTLSAENWAIREVQRLNIRIRLHREQLQEMEKKLKDIRKGDFETAKGLESIWMSKAEQEQMEENLRTISKKIAKANFLLRNMRSRWGLFKEKHRNLVPLVKDRLSRGITLAKIHEGVCSPTGSNESPSSTPSLNKDRKRRSPSPSAEDASKLAAWPEGIKHLAMKKRGSLDEREGKGTTADAAL